MAVSKGKVGGAVAAVVVLSVAAFFGVQGDSVEIIVVGQGTSILAYYFNEPLPVVAKGWEGKSGVRFYAITIDSVEVALTEADMGWSLTEESKPQAWAPYGWTTDRIVEDGELLDPKKDYGDRFLYPEAKR